MAIIVTGGAGFIGSNFVHQWIRDEDGTVINLDKLTYAGNPDNLIELRNTPEYVFVQGDIGDKKLVRELLHRYRPSSIINFAGESHVDRSIHKPDEFIQTNIVGVFNLLEEALAYWKRLDDTQKAGFRFLHVSTDEVYGSLGSEDPPFTEEKTYMPNSPYAASKASADHLVRAYHHTYGLPVLTTNCSNNYGPYQYPEKLIPLMILSAVHNKPLPVYGDGGNIRDWLYVGDHCEAIREVLKKGRIGETYNIGARCETTNLEVVRTICAILDEVKPRSKGSYGELIRFVADRPGHDRRYAMDSTKLEKEIGWRPKESFETGLRKTVHWYLENRSWAQNVMKGDWENWFKINYEERAPL